MPFKVIPSHENFASRDYYFYRFRVTDDHWSRKKGWMVGMAGGHESGSPRIADAVALPGLRVWRVPRFPLLVIALEREDRFDLIRVLHAKRDLPQDFPF